MNLFAKELKKVMQGILYIVFAGCVVLFYITQFGSVSKDIKQANNDVFDPEYKLTKPLPGQDNYGIKYLETPEVIMPKVIDTLFREWGVASYSAYPLGFYKSVHTNEEEQMKIEEIVINITGLNMEELDVLYFDWADKNIRETGDGKYEIVPGADFSSVIPILVDYETFKAEMSAVDEMLGGGSSYNPEGFIRFGKTPKSYEQALEDYNVIIYEDKISGAYARLFCDYMGIAVALFSVFVPVAYLMRDRKANMQQLIFSRKCSSVKLVGIRYLACLISVLLPVFILSVIPAVQLGIFAAKQGFPYDSFAFLKYTLVWVAPIAMVSCSVGFFFTIFTNTPIGIGVQFIWSLLDFSSIGSGLLYGVKVGKKLTIRHNLVGGRELIDWNSIYINRLAYVAFSIVLLCLSVIFYELQRRGRLDVRNSFAKIFQRSKNTVSLNAAA